MHTEWVCLSLGLQVLAGSMAQGCERADFVIAMDPGHTRASPGAISARGIPEARFNENLARRLVEELQQAGFAETFLTNKNQAPITLIGRAQLANERKVQLFLSIHHDSAQPHLLSTWSFRGQQHYYTDDLKGYSLFVSDKNGDAAGSLRFARLLGTQLRRACLTPTLHHAEKIPGENRDLLDAQLGIYRFDDLVVLKSANMPAVLLEAGLIVNRREELLLQRVSHQRKIASAVKDAVVAFCEGQTPQSTADAHCP